MNLNRFLVTTLSAGIAMMGTTSQAEAIVASVKTFGMAATGVAYPQDALAPAFNPAGNAEIGDRVDVGLTWVHTNGSANISGNQITSPPLPSPAIVALLGGPINGNYPAYKTRDNYTPDFGINKTFGDCCQYNVGLCVYNRNYSKTTYNRPFGLLGTSNLGMEYLHETVSGVLAWKINEYFNVGLNINYMVQRLKVNGLEKADFPAPPSIQHPVVTAHPGHLTNRGYSWSTGWGVTLGAQWHILPCLTVGATYQPETSMTKFGKYTGFLAKDGHFNIPTVWSAGIAWRWIECSTVAFDVQQYCWSGIRALNNNLLHDGHVQPLGSEHGPGFGWRNQTFYRIGIDYALTEDWIVRAGYRYGKSPVRPSQTVVNQLVDEVVEQYITVGATWMYSCTQELSGFFAYGIPNKVKGNGSIPPGLPAPFNALQPGTSPGFGGGESDLSQRQIVLGFSWGWNY